MRIAYHFFIILIFTFPPLLSQVSVHIDADAEISTEDAVLHISGDWHNAGDFIPSDARLVFCGSEDQTVYQPKGQRLAELQVNKISGALILTDTLRISDSLSLIQGNIQTTSDALLMLLSTAGSSSGDSSSFVNGPLARVYPVSLDPAVGAFPTGSDMDYRPVSVRLGSVADDSVTITVQQVNDNAQNLSTNYDGIDQVSAVRYWQIQPEGMGTFTDAQITFSYDTLYTDDGVEIGSELRIAQLDTTAAWVWNNIGGSGSGDYVGTIQSDPLPDFLSGYFTFADASGGGDISLPVFLTLFELSESREGVTINWTTGSELQNLYWMLQRREDIISENGQDTVVTGDFMTITRLDGQGTVSHESRYTFLDKDVEAGKQYTYRLVDVSADGRQHIHPEQTIVLNTPRKFALFQNYPNPFNPVTRLHYELPVRSDVRITIYNILGQKVITLVNERQEAGVYKILWDTQNQKSAPVASGMYILAMQAAGAENGGKETFNKVIKLLLIK